MAELIPGGKVVRIHASLLLLLLEMLRFILVSQVVGRRRLVDLLKAVRLVGRVVRSRDVLLVPRRCRRRISDTDYGRRLRQSFDCNSTALRPVADLRHDRAVALFPFSYTMFNICSLKIFLPALHQSWCEFLGSTL